MEESGHETDIPCRRQSDLKKSFKSAVRSLLTACSKHDFLDIFLKFSRAEQDLLYRLYTQVLILSTAISMSRTQTYGEGWYEEDCYLVKNGVFVASGCLAILGLVALTVSSTKVKVKKQQQFVMQFVIKDQNHEQKKSEEEQNQYQFKTNKSETIFHLVKEASSTINISRI